MPEIQPNRAALRAMVHFIAREYSARPEHLGSTRLHKILWNAEVRSVRQTGFPIVGETFIKQKHGPFAEHLAEVVDDLVRGRALHVSEPDDAFKPRLFVAKGQPDRRALTAEQWRIVERVMRDIVGDHTAGSISERSHGPVWQATEMFAPMPVDAEALCFVKPTAKIAAEIEKQIAAQL